MPMSIIRVSAWRSSGVCWRRKGFRVGIIAQPDWQSAEPFRGAGPPRLFFGVTGGNMDSMVNRYTSDRRLRAQRQLHAGRARAGSGRIVPPSSMRSGAARPIATCRSCWAGSKRRCGASRITTIGRTKCGDPILADAKADILLYGNAERAIVEVAHRMAAGERAPDSTMFAALR